MCNFTNMIGGLILYVRAPSLDHFVFENKNVKILFRFCRRHYFDLRIVQNHFPRLWLGVWERNERAIKFYEKKGFNSFADHIFTLGNDAQRDVLMELKLK